MQAHPDAVLVVAKAMVLLSVGVLSLYVENGWGGCGKSD